MLLVFDGTEFFNSLGYEPTSGDRLWIVRIKAISRHSGACSRPPFLGGTVNTGFRYRQWLVRKSYLFRIPPQTLIPQVRESA